MNRLDCDSRRNTIMLSVKCIPFQDCIYQHATVSYSTLTLGYWQHWSKQTHRQNLLNWQERLLWKIMHLTKFHRAPCELHTLRPRPFLCCTEQYNVQSSHTCPSSPLFFGALVVYNRVQMCTAQQVDRQWVYTAYAALTLWMQSQTRQCVRGPGRTGWDISVACETPARQQHTHDLILLHSTCSWINRTRMVQCLCVHVPP